MKQDNLVFRGENISGKVVKSIEVMATVIFDTNPGSLIYTKPVDAPGKEVHLQSLPFEKK